MNWVYKNVLPTDTISTKDYIPPRGYSSRYVEDNGIDLSGTTQTLSNDEITPNLMTRHSSASESADHVSGSFSHVDLCDIEGKSASVLSMLPLLNGLLRINLPISEAVEELSKHQRIAMRNKVESSCDEFDWGHLEEFYELAHEMALERAKD